MNKKGILFDMDGVLIQTLQVIEDFWNHWAKIHGVTITEEDFEKHIHGCPMWVTREKVFPHITDDQLQEMLDYLLEKEKTEQFEPVLGVVAFIKKAHELNIPMSVVTSGYESKVRSMMDQFGIKSYIKDFVTAEKVEKGKPDPEPYLKGAETLNLNPEDCLVFEDSVSGTLSAYKAGADVIGVNQPKLWDGLKEVNSFYQIENFNDLFWEDSSNLKLLKATSSRNASGDASADYLVKFV